MIDAHDLAYARTIPGRIVRARAAPYGGNAGINPHVSRFWRDNGTVTDIYHVKPIYYERVDGQWRPLAEVAAHAGNKNIVLLPSAMQRCSFRFLLWLMGRQRVLGGSLSFNYPNGAYAGVQPADIYTMSTWTGFPDANPETTCCDGVSTAWNTDWATTHALTAGTSSNASGATIQAGYSSAPLLSRGFILFDTSVAGIQGVGLIGSATVRLKSYSPSPTTVDNSDNDGNDYIVIVASTPASNTDIVDADFDQCGAITNPTALSDTIDLGTLTPTAYSTWTLNATGLAAISQTGITKLGFREGHDALNDTPDDFSFAPFFSSETSGTGSDPELAITYRPGGGFMSFLR